MFDLFHRNRTAEGPAHKSDVFCRMSGWAETELTSDTNARYQGHCGGPVTSVFKHYSKKIGENLGPNACSNLDQTDNTAFGQTLSHFHTHAT